MSAANLISPITCVLMWFYVEYTKQLYMRPIDYHQVYPNRTLRSDFTGQKPPKIGNHVCDTDNVKLALNGQYLKK